MPVVRPPRRRPRGCEGVLTASPPAERFIFSAGEGTQAAHRAEASDASEALAAVAW